MQQVSLLRKERKIVYDEDYNVMEVIGANVHRIRVRERIPLSGLAELFGVNKGTIIKWENGIDGGFDINKTSKLIRKYNLSHDDIMSGIKFTD